MPLTIKKATCCYCGAKTTLALSEGAPKLLQCDSCGAPLSRFKAIKQAAAGARPKRRPSPKPTRRDRDTDRRRERPRAGPPRKKRRQDNKRNRPGAFWRRVAEWLDDLEDLFD